MNFTFKNATEADLVRIYGPHGVIFGTPVRPPFPSPAEAVEEEVWPPKALRRECRSCGLLFTPARDEQRVCSEHCPGRSSRSYRGSGT